MRVRRYEESMAAAWDELVERASTATFLHTRRYLSYHGERFRDFSLSLTDEKDRVVGVFPAAADPQDDKMVASHPGISYGGLLHDGALRGERMLEAFEALKIYYREQGFEKLRYKAVPSIYHRVPSADDIYALFRLGAIRYRCDLSSAIDLEHRGTVSERRRRGLKKAQKRGVEVAEEAAFAESFWQVLEENLARRFNLRPVHSLEEILKLHSLFPENVEFVTARLNSEVIGGVVLFKSRRVMHAQYTASNEIGHEACALDTLFEHCIEKAKKTAARYFSFGVSTENDGQYLNANLYQYKSEFGAGGVVHEFYDIDLT